jgi:hypothetical protein
VAVCLLPGTEVAFENKVERHLTGFQLLFRRINPLPHRVARFRQVNMDNPRTHHDALEFPDGQVVLLTHLREGQRATVLQLPAQAKTVDAAQQPALPEAQRINRQRDPRSGGAHPLRRTLDSETKSREENCSGVRGRSRPSRSQSFSSGNNSSSSPN